VIGKIILHGRVNVAPEEVEQHRVADTAGHRSGRTVFGVGSGAARADRPIGGLATSRSARVARSRRITPGVFQSRPTHQKQPPAKIIGGLAALAAARPPAWADQQERPGWPAIEARFHVRNPEVFRLRE
jgi:hypothetical protein